MKMKPFLKTILGIAAALLCFALFIPCAHADEARIDITANPTELADTGAVTFNFVINNLNSDYPMTDIDILFNGVICYDLQDITIAPNWHAENISFSLNVSQSQLGKPITFVVSWVRNGEPMNQEASITIQQAENPTITITRAANTTNAKPGEKVVLTYTVKNTTKFDMSNITLIDENVSDSPVLQLDSLRASGTYSIDYSFIMGEESLISIPFATYTVNGKTKTFSSLDPLEIVMVRIQLALNVQMGTPTANGVTFTILIENTGTQAISAISVSDERANLVNAAPFSLAPGEETTLSFLIVPAMSEPLRTVQFSLSGTDSFGNPYSLAPEDGYEVYPFVDASQINVAVRAETVTPWTADSGKLSARITITNHSTVELTSITVLEASIGVIKNYDILTAGETSFELDVELGSPRNLSITVKGYDPTGMNRELASCVMPVAYGTETAPEETETPAPSGGNMTIFDGLMSGVAKVLVVLAVLMVLSFIILVVLFAMERAKTPRFTGDEKDELDDYFEETSNRQSQYTTYDDTPDQEEIRYTKRMFAPKDESPRNAQPETIFLPPPAAIDQPKPEPQDTVRRVAPENLTHPPRAPEPPPQASLNNETERHAAYRPAEPRTTAPQSAASKDKRPAPKQQKPPVQTQAPRVYDYRKQPKPQSAQKQTVTRVYRREHDQRDDEE